MHLIYENCVRFLLFVLRFTSLVRHFLPAVFQEHVTGHSTLRKRIIANDRSVAEEIQFKPGTSPFYGNLVQAGYAGVIPVTIT